MTSRNRLPKQYYISALLLINLIVLAAGLTGYLGMRQACMFFLGESGLVALLAVAIYARYLIVFGLLSYAVGMIVYLANPDLLANPQPILLFWSLYSLCWLAYIEAGKGSYGQLLRKLRPAEQLGFYIFYMGMALVLCFFLTRAVMPAVALFPHPASYYYTLVAVALLVPTISMGLLKMIDMIGQRHYIDFILGTYLQPQERNSIVLFLDMVGSSGIAEKLSPQESMDFIARFIYDSSYIFRIHGGDILNYTGDGLVVLWPRKHSNQVLAAVHQMQSHFASRAVRIRYKQKFGIIPEFRIGIHAGPVVISQIGEEKLFLGLYGDVVNIAARLEQMNKILGTTVLLSSEVVYGLNQGWKALLKPLGERSVRGRDEKIAVYALYKEV